MSGGTEASQVRSLQSTIGDYDHACVNFCPGFRAQEDSRLTCRFPITPNGVGLHTGGLFHAALCHAYQFFNFKQAGGHTVGLY